jgi:hypothetical protein
MIVPGGSMFKVSFETPSRTIHLIRGFSRHGGLNISSDRRAATQVRRHKKTMPFHVASRRMSS